MEMRCASGLSLSFISLSICKYSRQWLYVCYVSHQFRKCLDSNSEISSQVKSKSPQPTSLAKAYANEMVCAHIVHEILGLLSNLNACVRRWHVSRR